MLFSAPAFLWGLAAVLIPIAIHLFNLRRYRKVYFSNVDRLSELHNESRRRATVRQWLVLAARVLAIVFIVLAFAQPVLPKGGVASPQTAEGRCAVSIYVDNSFSMASASVQGSLVDEARRKVEEIASAYSRDSRFQLLTNDMKGEEMRWLNRDELFEAADRLQPSASTRLMSYVATRQSDFLRQDRSSARHAYIISDFQRSTADLEALPEDSTVFFTLVPLAAVAADNVYIDTVELDAPAYFVGGTVSARVTLRNSGSSDAEKVPVKLYIDGLERALATVDIPAGGTGESVLRFGLDHAGWADGRVTVDDYPVTFDDNYHFAISVGDRIGMVEVDGHGANANLHRLFAADSAIDYRQTNRVPPAIEADCGFVILNEVDDLTTGMVQMLAGWVAEGGSLLVVPPAAKTAEGLRQLAEAVQAPVYDNWIQKPAKATAVDVKAPLFRDVFSATTDEMEMPSVQGHYTFRSGQAIRQSLITLADGGDLLCVTPCGKGRLYQMAAPLTSEWTDFVSQALFVPTLYNMALYSRPLPPASHSLGSSEPIVLQESYSIDGEMPELSDGTSSFIPDLRRVGSRWMLTLHGEITADGIYILDREHLAFNYSRLESRLDFYSRDEVAAAIDGRHGYSVVRNAAKPLDQQLRERDNGHSLWRLCLVLALLMLAAETILLKINPTKHHAAT